MNHKIKIDGEILEVTEYEDRYGTTTIELEDGTEWYLFYSREEAGEAAREYWKYMAQNDPQEFTCMVGEDTLVKWALGQYAGPGYTQVRSLDEWLDLWLDIPEEHFAAYDSAEVDAVFFEDGDLECGEKVVIYRYN
jgi:hypothetical protein